MPTASAIETAPAIGKSAFADELPADIPGAAAPSTAVKGRMAPADTSKGKAQAPPEPSWVKVAALPDTPKAGTATPHHIPRAETAVSRCSPVALRAAAPRGATSG